MELSFIDVLRPGGEKLKKFAKIMEDSLTAFSNITNIPITFFSPQGDIQWEFNKERKFCISNAQYYDGDSSCMQNLKSAMKMAYQLGELYIFVCNTGLINMCYAFVYEDVLLGYFNAGPVAMGKNKSHTIADFYKKVPQESIDLPLLMSVTHDLTVHSPEEITFLSTLYLNALGSPFAAAAQPFNPNRQQALEQSGIGTKIIEMKKSRIKIKYPLKQEQEFLTSINAGDADKSSLLFSKYLENLMVFEGGDLSVIKLRLVLLFSKLFNLENDWERNDRDILQLESIHQASTFTDLKEKSILIIQWIAKHLSKQTYSGDSELVAQAAAFIRQYFPDEISLCSIAEHVHANPTYLSTLFKKEMNLSIVDYIHEVRLSAAAKALTEGNDSITEIALACGFKELSYFSRLFKEKYGITPRQYRSSHK